MTDGLPTARTALRTGYVRMLVFCNSCRHQADADLEALVDDRVIAACLVQLLLAGGRINVGNIDVT